MTIAIALQVGDCIVLGADSASTMSSGRGIANVYFNAEKIVDLRKDLRVGMITFGNGSLAGRSIASHAKDLRLLLADQSDPLGLVKNTYTIEQVARNVQQYFIEGLYRKEFPRIGKDSNGGVVKTFARMGFFVAGYSAGSRDGELWRVEVDGAGVATCANSFKPGDCGIDTDGQPEAFSRLVYGFSPKIHKALVDAAGVTDQEAHDFLTNHGSAELFSQGMPQQDAIDLVQYLCDVTAGFVRFHPGAPTVHPPIDIATINYHEGFRWVRRKHYFDPSLNSAIVCG